MQIIRLGNKAVGGSPTLKVGVLKMTSDIGVSVVIVSLTDDTGYQERYAKHKG